MSEYGDYYREKYQKLLEQILEAQKILNEWNDSFDDSEMADWLFRLRNCLGQSVPAKERSDQT